VRMPVSEPHPELEDLGLGRWEPVEDPTQRGHQLRRGLLGLLASDRASLRARTVTTSPRVAGGVRSTAT